MLSKRSLVIYYLRAYALEIAIAIVIAAAVIFIFLSTFLKVQPVQSADWPELNKYFQQSVATPEYLRLHAYHGRPKNVIFEPGKPPVFVNKAGQRCLFDYPKKGKRNG